MARPTTAVPGAPCWIDLLTADPQRSRDFYTKLMGWTADEPDQAHGGYFTFRRDGILVAGCMGRQEGMQGPPQDTWSIHLASTDTRRTLETAVANGATVAVPAMDVDDLGTMGMVVDPAGAAVGVWQPGTHQGFGIVYEPGGPAWFELHTTQYERCLDFYRTVFGWKTQPMETPDFRYSVLQPGEEQLAGVMDDSKFAPEGTPAYWLLYLSAENTDATLARVRELGGTVTREAEDTPYGRMASVTDPTGAAFNVIGPNVGAATPAGAAQGSAS